MAELTFGQNAVGYSENAENAFEKEIKETFANAITLLNDARETAFSAEEKRAYSLAITEAETACLWACYGISRAN